VFLFINISFGYSQDARPRQRIYFVSDAQAPLPVEKIFLKAYRNEEARDSLFADIIHRHPGNLFMLGDMTSRGSDEKAWVPLDTFRNSLRKTNTKIYAIPGNHEYKSSSSVGIQLFKDRFPERWLNGYCINVDSIAIEMLNSNFSDLSKDEISKQLTRYRSEMDSMDRDPATRAIIVCTHQAPYSNSKAVGSDKEVANLIVPVFTKSQKSILFISGHSHNLEYFSDTIGKHFLVIGGGGGLTQPLIPMNEPRCNDLLNQNVKPVYFYLVIEKNGNCLKLFARGFKKDFRFFELEIGTICRQINSPSPPEVDFFLTLADLF
jgi:Calcineurin-like phosphoesterase.